MMSQPPQWPDQSAQPVQPTRTLGGGFPLSRLAQAARSRLGLAAVAVVSSLLIVVLLCTLVLVLSNNARGAIAGDQAQNGQTGQNGQTQNSQAATAGTDGGTGNGGTPSSGGGGGISGGGGTGANQPTPTSSGGAATPTPTSGIAVVGGGGLTLAPTVHQVVSQATLSGTSVGPVVAICPAGELALSGGWAVAYNSGATIYSSKRTGTGSWGVYVRHSSSVGVTAYAECLANASGATITEQAAYTSVSPDNVGTPAASCNAGEVLVGGGFAFQNGLELYYFDANSATQWHGYAWNRGSSSALFNIYAECLTYANAHSSQTAFSGNVSVAEGARGGTTSKACPSGAYVSGGGYRYDTKAFVYATWASGNGTTWTADLYANDGADETLGSWAMCLGFS